MADEKVQVRIKPLMGIGGVGNAGDEVWMSREDAEMYVRDGYVEYVDPPAAKAASPQIEDHDLAGVAEESHKIMKPRSKRK